MNVDKVLLLLLVFSVQMTLQTYNLFRQEQCLYNKSLLKHNSTNLKAGGEKGKESRKEGMEERQAGSVSIVDMFGSHFHLF